MNRIQTAAMLNHHENVQQAKRRGDSDEKIACYDPLGVQAQEGRPAQVASPSAPRTPRKILPHGSRRNPNSQTAEANLNVQIVDIKISISGTNSSIDLNFSLWNDLRSERRAIRNLQFMHGFCTDASRFEWMLLV